MLVEHESKRRKKRKKKKDGGQDRVINVTKVEALWK